MKKIGKLVIVLIGIMMLMLFTSCKYSVKDDVGYGLEPDDGGWFIEPAYEKGDDVGNEVSIETYITNVFGDRVTSIGEGRYQIAETPFITCAVANSSYFSMDSNTASYGTMKNCIMNYQTLRKEYFSSIRTDELLNYFSYSYEGSKDEDFTSFASVSKAPWNEDSYLLNVAIKTKQVRIEDNDKGSNFVFLIDVSGSMRGENRIELVKKSFNMLVDNLQDEDTISIVTYASGVHTILSGERVKNKSKIKDAINGLVASGSTNGGDGLVRSYSLAEDYFIEGGNNRIIIASDGDFNVGVSDTMSLQELLQAKARIGIYTTVLGFGMGNYRDDMMYTIAKYGNGNYAFISSLEDAVKVLIDELDTSFCVVASDVKTKLDFNIDNVLEYRMIGYENKVLSQEQYEDTNTDAGEVGSNHQTVVCYEIKIKEGLDVSKISDLVSLEIKYKDPETREDKVYNDSFDDEVICELEDASADFKFVCCIIEFAMVLRDSEFKGTSSLNDVYDRLNSINDYLKEDANKIEFKGLVEVAMAKMETVE